MHYKAFLDVIEKLKESKLGESSLSKAGEMMSEYVFKYVNNINDFQDTVTTLENNLKLLSAKASDVEEEIKNAELSGKKKRKREVEEWLSQVKSIDAERATGTEPAGGFMTGFLDGGRLAQLNHRVEKLFEKSRYFGELLLDVCGSQSIRFPEPKVVGVAFHENLKNILKLLETGKVSSIAVFGMGGAGKTTLASQIHNRLVEQSAGGVFWVTVSQGINIKSLQDKIASVLGVKNLFDGDDVIITRGAKLSGVLSKMSNSVLILDDVWEIIKLSELGCTVSKEGCRLIITTRSTKVCVGIGCEAIIAVEKLNEDDALELFSETLGKRDKIKF